MSKASPSTSSPSPSPAQVISAQLASLARDRGLAIDARNAALSKRGDLLAANAADAAIEACDLEIIRANRAVERADGFASALREKSAAAEATERNAEWNAVYPAHVEKLQKFTGLLRELLALQREIIVENAALHGKFDHVTAYLAYPADYIIRREVVEGWANQVRDATAAEARFSKRIQK